MMMKGHNRMKLLAMVLSLFLTIPLSVVSAVAASAIMKVKHKAPKHYIPGFRINLDAEIADETGVLLSRCYFKTKKEKDFIFVDMESMADGQQAPPSSSKIREWLKSSPSTPSQHYKVTLPAPWVQSEAVEYVFVVVNKEKKVVRSQVFTMKEKKTKEASLWKGPGEVKEIRVDLAQEAIEDYEVMQKRLVEAYKDKLPEWQEARARGQLKAKTDLDKAPDGLEGFYDSIVVTPVAPSMKYGLLAKGLYTTEQVDAAGGLASAASSTGATAGGTISAAGGGIGLGWIAGGAAVVAGGAAAAGGGGGGGGNGGTHQDGTTSTTTVRTTTTTTTSTTTVPPTTTSTTTTPACVPPENWDARSPQQNIQPGDDVVIIIDVGMPGASVCYNVTPVGISACQTADTNGQISFTIPNIPSYVLIGVAAETHGEYCGMRSWQLSL